MWNPSSPARCWKGPGAVLVAAARPGHGPEKRRLGRLAWSGARFPSPGTGLERAVPGVTRRPHVMERKRPRQGPLSQGGRASRGKGPGQPPRALLGERALAPSVGASPSRGALWELRVPLSPRPRTPGQEIVSGL